MILMGHGGSNPPPGARAEIEESTRKALFAKAEEAIHYLLERPC